MFKLLKLLGLGVALALLALATGNIGQVSIAQSCSVVLRPGDSIQNAINNVSPNSVICLTENTWQENLAITKDNLTLRGQGPSRTFIIGSVLVQVAGRFTVENLTLNAQVQFGLVHTPWPMFQHDPQHTGRSPYVGPATPTLKWRFRDTTSIGFSSPVIGADGTIYMCIAEYLYAINPDGTRKWRYEACSSFSDLTPAIGVDGTIYVGRLYAINPDGTQKWWFIPKDPAGYAEHLLSFSPTIGADGTIYFTSFYSSGIYYNIGSLYAINPDGREKWRFRTDPFSYVRVGSSPAIGADGTIYAQFGAYLYAINPDGTEKWRFSCPSRSSPAIGADGTIYVGSEYELCAIAPNGKEKWRFNIGYEILSSPAIGFDGTIYVGTYNHLFAINPDGKEKWRFKTGGRVNSSPAIGADGTIYVGSRDHYLYAIAPNGAQKWRFDIGYETDSSPAIGADGTIYVGSGYYLYAIGK
jgi:outer membrane protein assembly factor BamB